LDFFWTTQQSEYKNEIIDFAKANLNASYIDNDQNCKFSRKEWQACADFGILGLSVPKAYSNQSEDIDILSAIYAMEGLGYACKDNGLPFALNAQMWTVQLPIAQNGLQVMRSPNLKLDLMFLACKLQLQK